MASTDGNVLGAFVNDVADQPSVFFMADETVATRCREVIKHTFDACTCVVAGRATCGVLADYIAMHSQA